MLLSDNDRPEWPDSLHSERVKSTPVSFRVTTVFRKCNLQALYATNALQGATFKDVKIYLLRHLLYELLSSSKYRYEYVSLDLEFTISTDIAFPSCTSKSIVQPPIVCFPLPDVMITGSDVSLM